jgi:hypothetical protein
LNIDGMGYKEMERAQKEQGKSQNQHKEIF